MTLELETRLANYGAPCENSFFQDRSVWFSDFQLSNSFWRAWKTFRGMYRNMGSILWKFRVMKWPRRFWSSESPVEHWSTLRIKPSESPPKTQKTLQRPCLNMTFFKNGSVPIIFQIIFHSFRIFQVGYNTPKVADGFPSGGCTTDGDFTNFAGTILGAGSTTGG